MYKKIFALFFIMLLTGTVYSKTLDSVNFTENGELAVERGETKCKNYEFNKLYEEENSKIIANIIIDNYIPTKNQINLEVFFNDKIIANLDETQILHKNILEINEPQYAKNQLKVCVFNNALPKIIISKESTVKTHLLGEIKKDLDFYQKVLANTTFTHEMIPIEVYARNSGYDELEINIDYASETFLQNSTLETVSGETNYKGIIKPGETISFKYYLKTNKNIEFATPRAKLSYIDEYDNEIVIYAKQDIIAVSENQNKIEVYVDLEKDVLVNTPVHGKIILKNISQTEIRNINIETNFDGKIYFSKRNIPLLNKFEIIEIPFEINTDEIKKYTFNATIYYNLGNIENGISTQTITVNAMQKKDYVKETIGVFLLIVIAIYIWIVRI